MRNLLLLGAAAAALALSGAAASAEPKEHEVTIPAYFFGAQSLDQATTGSVIHEGRSAYIVDDQSAAPSASALNRAPRS